VAGCCECGDEPSGSCATEIVIIRRCEYCTSSKRCVGRKAINCYRTSKANKTLVQYKAGKVPETVSIQHITLTSGTRTYYGKIRDSGLKISACFLLLYLFVVYKTSLYKYITRVCAVESCESKPHSQHRLPFTSSALDVYFRRNAVQLPKI
jgi:hypothetical protein